MSLDLEVAEAINTLPNTQLRVEFLASRQPNEHLMGISPVSPVEDMEKQAFLEENIAAEERRKLEAEEMEKDMSLRKRPWWTRLFFSRAVT
jgi:hypothetical protein